MLTGKPCEIWFDNNGKGYLSISPEFLLENDKNS